MRISLIEFQEKINNLKEHINRTETLIAYLDRKAGLGDAEAIELLRSISRDRSFNYRSNVISLYGYFEQFVESIIAEYLKELCSLQPNYHDMSKKLIENYPTLMFSLYGKLSYPKFAALSEKDITASLFETINLNKSSIRSEAFIQNGGNYRHSEIETAFIRLGVVGLGNNLRLYNPLYELLKVSYGEDKIKSMPIEDAYLTLDEFVNRRNDIAHGVNQIPIVNGIDFIDQFVSYLEKYSIALNDLLTDLLYEKRFAQGVEIAPLRVFALGDKTKPKQTMGVELENMHLQIGMKLMCKHPKSHYPNYEIMEIIGICDNKTPVETFEITTKRPIGIKVSAPITEGCRFVFL